MASSCTIGGVERAILSRVPKTMPGHNVMQHAAVAAVFRQSESELELLMIQRAVRDGDPWSGHMALPGGHVEAGESPREAAIRETAEELAIDLSSSARFLGALSQNIARAKGRIIPLVVTPFIYVTTSSITPVSNEEVADVVWVPLRYLCDPKNRSVFRYHMKGVNLTLPCIDYDGYRIWGLTLRMLDELIKRLQKR